MKEPREVWAALGATDNEHDTSPYPDLLADDVVVHLPGDNRTEGIAAYRGFIEALFAGLPDYHAEPEEVMSQGGSVFVHFTITGTHTGELFGIPASGRAVRYSGCSLWHVRQDKIAEGWIYPDRAAMLQQLGLDEAPVGRSGV